MITADQIVAHLVGDYLLQSDWMANEKTKRSIAAAVHALFYSLPFLFFRPSVVAWAFIVLTHFIIDRWRLARYVCWLKNWIAPWLTWRLKRFPFVFFGVRDGAPWKVCTATGYPPEKPVWLAFWLMIIADNTMHLILNGIALKYL